MATINNGFQNASSIQPPQPPQPPQHQTQESVASSGSSITGRPSHEPAASVPGMSHSSPGSTVPAAQNTATQVDLTEIDGGLGMLLERSRQSLASCKESVAFLKSRAKVEEEYSRNLQKVVLNTLKTMDRTHARDNSHQATWQRLVEVHETMAANRMKFSITLSEMSDDLSSYVKEKEKIRRQLKETEMRYQKSIEDIEAALDKARYKYEVYSSEWEKLLIKSGNSRSDGASAVGVWAGPGAGSAPTSKSRNMGNAVTGIFSKHKGTVQENLERMGKEAEVKVKVANNNYRKLLNSTNAIRRDFYDVQLPKILASVMSLIEEVDECLKWSLGKYAYAYECAVLADALTLKPSNGDPGMMEMIEDIDSKTDLDNFLRFTAHQSGRVDRTSIPYKEYEMSPIARTYANPKTIFGVPLATQVERDGHPIPLIIVKCTKAVEAFGLQNEGIYRQSGQSSQVARLRNEFNLDADNVDLQPSANAADINNITSVLKMYLRELPGGLIPHPHRDKLLGMFPFEDDQQPQQDTENMVNVVVRTMRALPRMNVEILNYLVAHLDKVQAFQEFNMMNSENLGIVFGPTIIPSGDDPVNAAMDIRRSAKVVKFMLDNRRAIFELL